MLLDSLDRSHVSPDFPSDHSCLPDMTVIDTPTAPGCTRRSESHSRSLMIQVPPHGVYLSPLLEPLTASHSSSPSYDGSLSSPGFHSLGSWSTSGMTSNDVESRTSSLEQTMEQVSNQYPALSSPAVQDGSPANDAGPSSFGYPASPSSPHNAAYFSPPHSRSPSSLSLNPISWSQHLDQTFSNQPSSGDYDPVSIWVQGVDGQAYTPGTYALHLSLTEEGALRSQATGSSESSSRNPAFDLNHPWPSDFSALPSPNPSLSSLPRTPYPHPHPPYSGNPYNSATIHNGVTDGTWNQSSYGSRPSSYYGEANLGAGLGLQHSYIPAPQNYTTTEVSRHDDPSLGLGNLSIGSPSSNFVHTALPCSPTSPYLHTGTTEPARGRSQQLYVPGTPSSRSQSSSDHRSASDFQRSPSTSVTSLSDFGERSGYLKVDGFFRREPTGLSRYSQGLASSEGTVGEPGTPGRSTHPDRQSTMTQAEFSACKPQETSFPSTSNIGPVLPFLFQDVGGSSAEIDYSNGSNYPLVAEPLSFDTAEPSLQGHPFLPPDAGFFAPSPSRGTNVESSEHALWGVDAGLTLEGSTSKSVEIARRPAQHRHHSGVQSRRQRQDLPSRMRKTKGGRTFTSLADAIHQQFQSVHNVRVPWSRVIHHILRNHGGPLTRRDIVNELLQYSPNGSCEGFENYLAQRLGHLLTVNKSLFARGPDRAWEAV